VDFFAFILKQLEGSELRRKSGILEILFLCFLGSGEAYGVNYGSVLMEQGKVSPLSFTYEIGRKEEVVFNNIVRRLCKRELGHTTFRSGGATTERRRLTACA
jgi:hypothetical protein